MEVTITRDDLAYARDEGTVIIMTGTGPDGERVTFGGDRRAVEALAEGVYAEGEATAVVEPYQVLNTVPQRIASVARHHSGRPSPEEVSAYLPGNYRVLWSDDERVMIAGNDNASAAQPSLVGRVLAYLGRVVSDIHQGLVNGLDALWYG